MLWQMYEASLDAPATTPPAGATFAAYAETLIAQGLPQGASDKLYLRFERLGQGRKAGQIAVMATWRARSLALGHVDHIGVFSQTDASALRSACAQQGLAIIDNC